MRVLRRKRLREVEKFIAVHEKFSEIKGLELYVSFVSEDDGFNIRVEGRGAGDGGDIEECYLFNSGVSFEIARETYRILR